jgi:hypothetical protein
MNKNANYEARKFQAVLPAPGWRVVECHFVDSGDAAFTETPLIGWLVTGGKVEPIYWDDGEERVRTFPDQELHQGRYTSFKLLNPNQELDEKTRKHLELMATREDGYPCWSKKFRLETKHKIQTVLYGSHPTALTEKELVERQVSQYAAFALNDMKDEGLIVEDTNGRFNLTDKGLSEARAAGHKTAVSGG